MARPRTVAVLVLCALALVATFAGEGDAASIQATIYIAAAWLLIGTSDR